MEERDYWQDHTCIWRIPALDGVPERTVGVSGIVFVQDARAIATQYEYKEPLTEKQINWIITHEPSFGYFNCDIIYHRAAEKTGNPQIVQQRAIG